MRVNRIQKRYSQTPLLDWFFFFFFLMWLCLTFTTALKQQGPVHQWAAGPTYWAQFWLPHQPFVEERSAKVAAQGCIFKLVYGIALGCFITLSPSTYRRTNHNFSRTYSNKKTTMKRYIKVMSGFKTHNQSWGGEKISLISDSCNN